MRCLCHYWLDSPTRKKREEEGRRGCPTGWWAPTGEGYCRGEVTRERKQQRERKKIRLNVLCSAEKTIRFLCCLIFYGTSIEIIPSEIVNSDRHSVKNICLSVDIDFGAGGKTGAMGGYYFRRN